jgi:hypothetical protein
MPASKKEKREKGKSYGESIAHNHKDCARKNQTSKSNTRAASRTVEFCFQELQPKPFFWKRPPPSWNLDRIEHGVRSQR